MWELCVFLFWALLVLSLAFSLGCEMLVASCCCCLPVPGLWALFVVLVVLFIRFSCCGLLPLSLVFRGGAVRFSLFWPSVVCLFSFCFLVFRFPFW